MATKDAKKNALKRKEVLEDESPETDELNGGLANLEMSTDEEGDDDASSDDGKIDEFPEIDEGSNDEDEGGSQSEADDNDEKDESTDEEKDEDSDSDTPSHNIFPRSKTVISDITGHPKRVYPEIEPEYDSDSSTEDVSKHRTSKKISLTRG